MGLFSIFKRKKKNADPAASEMIYSTYIESDTSKKVDKKEAAKPAPEKKAAPAKADTKKAESKTAEKKAESKPVAKPTPEAKKSEPKVTVKPKAEKSDKPATTAAKKTEAPIPKAAKKAAPVAPTVAIDETEPLDEGATVTESKNTRTGKFELKKAKDGRYHFNLYASNHVLIARSQIYSSSTKAMQGINSVISNAPRAQIEDQTLKTAITVPFPKWEIYLDNAGQYRFRLCASNGSCICHSRGYTTKASCKNGIDSITRFANDAEIKKVYLDKK